MRKQSPPPPLNYPSPPQPRSTPLPSSRPSPPADTARTHQSLPLPALSLAPASSVPLPGLAHPRHTPPPPGIFHPFPSLHPCLTPSCISPSLTPPCPYLRPAAPLPSSLSPPILHRREIAITSPLHKASQRSREVNWPRRS